jgi:hypothetical protein
MSANPIKEGLVAASEIERGLRQAATLDELGTSFDVAVRTLAATDPRRPYLEWESWLYRYHLGPGDQAREQPDTILQPLHEAGEYRFPPRVADFPSDAVPYFEARAALTTYSNARARIADFLWLRRREVAFADTAIEAYAAAALLVVQSEQEGQLEAVESLRRATVLARRLGRPLAPLRAAVQGVADRLRDGTGLLSMLVRGAVDVIAEDAGLAEPLSRELLRLADAAAAAGSQSRSHERNLLDAAIDLAKTRDDVAGVAALRQRRARSFEQEADERPQPLVQTVRLREAAQAFAELGMREDLTRVERKLHEAARAAEANLSEISVEDSISVDDLRQELRKLVELGRRHSPWAHLHVFARRGLWPPWAEVIARTAELRRQSPLQALVTRVVLGPDWRPLPRPADPAAAQRFDEIERYVQDVQMTLGLKVFEVELLRELDAWNVELLLDALRVGILFDPEVLAATAPGVRAFEAGRDWEALHTLVPQIERVIRRLAVGVKAPTYSFELATGEIQWRSLPALLGEPAVQAVLRRLAPDLPEELRNLLLDSRGLNLRNDVAHGIRPIGESARPFALLCLSVLLTLAGLTVRPAEDRPPQTEGS